MTTSLFGSSIKRREDPRLITGKGTYVDDVRLVGMLHLSLVRSPYAHANIKSMERLRQKPDEHFHGTRNITTVGIASDEISGFPPLDAVNFTEVFEITANELKPQMHHTNVSIDLTDTFAEPIITSRHAKILRKAIFDDAYPWIVVTLFETCPDQ